MVGYVFLFHLPYVNFFCVLPILSSFLDATVHLIDAIGKFCYFLCFENAFIFVRYFLIILLLINSIR